MSLSEISFFLTHFDSEGSEDDVGGGQICDDQSQGNFKQMPGKLSLSR
jgi:hypothetical protein